MKEEIAKAEKWAYENLLKSKVYHKELKAYILFDKSGIDHCIRVKTYPLKINLIYKVKELIDKSTLYSVEPDKKKRPDIIKVYRLVSKIELSNKLYFVYIVIRERKDGHFYYDNGIIKEKI